MGPAGPAGPVTPEQWWAQVVHPLLMVVGGGLLVAGVGLPGLLLGASIVLLAAALRP